LKILKGEGIKKEYKGKPLKMIYVLSHVQDYQAGAEVAVVTMNGSHVGSSDRSAKVIETLH
jgi:hypothetical protein